MIGEEKKGVDGPEGIKKLESQSSLDHSEMWLSKKLNITFIGL